MPALPSVPGVVQLAFGTLMIDDTYLAINRLHFHYTGAAPTSGQMSSFATTCLTAWGSAIEPSMCQDKKSQQLVAIDLSSPTGATAEVTDGTRGALTGAPLPDDTSLVMSATVSRRYRGGHPRSYLALGDATSLLDGHTWAGAFLTAVTTAWAGFMTAVEGAGWAGAGTITPVNVSYYEGYHLVTYPSGRSRDVPTLRVGGPVVDPISAFVARARVGTQRRRLGR
jgi:hypothetical protein